VLKWTKSGKNLQYQDRDIGKAAKTTEERCGILENMGEGEKILSI